MGSWYLDLMEFQLWTSACTLGRLSQVSFPESLDSDQNNTFLTDFAADWTSLLQQQTNDKIESR